MAITLNELRSAFDQADSLTGWTGHDTLITSNPVPIEATGCVGANVGNEIFVGYHTISSTDLSDAVIYCWVFSRLSLGDTLDTNGGLMIMAADTTPDRIGYKVNGADKAAFRHDDGPTGWQCPALDTTSLPATYVDAGSAISIDWTAILEVGTIVNSLSAAPGMNPTYQADIMRYLLPANNNGCAADIVGGTEGDPGLFSEIATADRQVGNLQAHGLVRQLAAGVVGVQGPLRFGNATGTSASWFEDSNGTLVFEDRGFRTDLYKIFITDNGTGTTTFRLHGYALIAPTGVGAEFDADTDTDVTDVVIDNGSRIAGFIGGVGLQSGHTVTNTTITECGQVRANGATMNGSSVLQSTVAANNSSLQWNVNTDTDGLLDGMTFDKTSGTAHHAIEFGTAIADAASFTLTGCNFGTDFSATEDGSTGDETFHFLDTTGSITLSLAGCTGNFGYRTEGVAVSIVADPIIIDINVNDNLGVPLIDARVLVEAADGAGVLPFQETVTITRSGSVASVAHTTHGMINDDVSIIRYVEDTQYAGAHIISNVSTNAYDYTVDSPLPASPAVGLNTDLIDAQTEVDYDDSPTSEGSFTAGTGYAVSDALTLDKGISVTVDMIDSSDGSVTEFTVDSSSQSARIFENELLKAGGGGGSQSVIDIGSNTDASSGTVLNDSFTLSSGINRKMVVWGTHKGTNTTLTATYDSNAMTSIANTENFGVGEMEMFWYDIPDGHSGSKTIEVTLGIATANREIIWAVIENCASGAEEDFEAITAQIGSSPESITATNTTDDAFLIHAFSDDGTGSSFLSGALDVEELDVAGVTGTIHVVSEVVDSTGAQVTESIWSGGNNAYTIIGAIFGT